MKKLAKYRDVLFLIFSIFVVIGVLFNITTDALKTKALANNSNPAPSESPKKSTKDFQSLDEHINYSVPLLWVKADQVDKQFGNKTLVALTSPDFEASSSAGTKNGIRIIINRSYDPKAEATVQNKLNAHYQFYDYNIRALTVGGKSAMTMHEDLSGHNRFIFIANSDHLWQIVISSKSLEEEQKFDGLINPFLDSIRFKD